ncbi:MAG: polysaccharide biosynthesis/export family protein [Deltaproteobacteria bacterium]|nr:polysaccharide biosynthesis/export family protein [Deltaproteobacteria bacterium]
MNSKNQTVRRAVCLIMLLACTGCSLPGRDIIKTISVAPGSDGAAGLSAADRAALESIKKASAGSGAQAGLHSVLTGTARTVTVAEYLRLYPDADGKGTADYRVGGNDVLSITVYGEPDLSSPALRVAADGYISFPLIGRLKVGGLTTARVEALIAGRLARGYLLGAHVTVNVTEYNSKWFLVLGAVEKPGSYPLAANEQILNAISKAGGIPQEQKGAGRKAKLVRTVHAGTAREEQLVIDIDLQDIMQGAGRHANLFLSDKDALFISMPENYYLLGEVKKPGMYPLAERDISLVEGIGIAGGFTNLAARNSTRIIRSQNGRETIIVVRVDAVTRAGMQLREIILQPNDIVIVPQSFF